MSEDANITALGEELKKVKNNIKRVKNIGIFLVIVFIVYVVLFVVFVLASMMALQLGGNGDAEFLLLILTLPGVLLPLMGLWLWLGKKNQKWIEQEDELKKRLLALLYPTPNCSNCGKPFSEGSKFCIYCGNKRQS